ncbi:MAG: D-alanyl-D-alanine carboxypeptidase/D-alanyl-D-alanine-endopeptidase [Phycisphaerae bacterium]|nr:D-alanyl-D-alanine carboxypeptidase/D-alanyl-D-alanine-endopeptidase [Phycisphaerae bacterium]
MRRISGTPLGGSVAVLLAMTGMCPSPASGTDQTTLGEEIAALVNDTQWGKMSIGVCVETLGAQPKLVFEHKSRELLKPASNQKLVTTAAALCLLPPDFSYRTILALQGKDLVVIGSGDPSFGDSRLAEQAREQMTADFHQWAAKLKAAGISRIDGDLLFDDFAFEQQFVHPNWVSRFNLQTWYSAPVGGLNFNDNCVDVIIKRGAGTGQPAQVTLIPTTPYIKLHNKAVTAAKGEPTVRRLGNGPLTISVTGSVSRGNSQDNPLSIAVTDPGEFFASTCRTALASQGVEIAGTTRRQQIRQPGDELPAGLKVIAVRETRLKDILWRVNKSSINMFAEALLKSLGACQGPSKPPRQGTLENGQAAVRRFLGTLGLTEDLYLIDDGSGLSHENRLAATTLVRVLQHMDRQPTRETWWNNLAEPGQTDSTLSRRMRNMKGKVFAKTGHIAGVSTLSGYVIGANQQKYVFSVLCNDTQKAKANSGSGNRLQDQICQLLANWGANSTRTAN